MAARGGRLYGHSDHAILSAIAASIVPVQRSGEMVDLINRTRA